jgi:hypothetical protein
MSIWPWKKKREDTEDVAEVKPPDVELTTATIQATEGLNDATRVSRYVEDGGEVVDLSNKARLPHDGFAPDGELMQPWNQARVGIKEGIASIARRDRWR